MTNPNPIIQQAEELSSSVLWSTVVNELDRKIRYETQKLRSCSPDELKEIQVRIACYESVKNIPQDIVDRES